MYCNKVVNAGSLSLSPAIFIFFSPDLLLK